MYSHSAGGSAAQAVTPSPGRRRPGVVGLPRRACRGRTRERHPPSSPRAQGRQCLPPPGATTTRSVRSCVHLLRISRRRASAPYQRVLLNPGHAVERHTHQHKNTHTRIHTLRLASRHRLASRVHAHIHTHTWATDPVPTAGTAGGPLTAISEPESSSSVPSTLAGSLCCSVSSWFGRRSERSSSHAKERSAGPETPLSSLGENRSEGVCDEKELTTVS